MVGETVVEGVEVVLVVLGDVLKVVAGVFIISGVGVGVTLTAVFSLGKNKNIKLAPAKNATSETNINHIGAILSVFLGLNSYIIFFSPYFDYKSKLLLLTTFGCRDREVILY